VAVNPAGTLVYVTTESGGNDVAVIDAGTNTVLTRVPVPFPWGVAVNPAGTRVYVTSVSTNSVAVIDTSTHTVIGSIPVGSTPIAFGQFIRP
jgi:YVTN family beta-propeller protein